MSKIKLQRDEATPTPETEPRLLGVIHLSTEDSALFDACVASEEEEIRRIVEERVKALRREVSARLRDFAIQRKVRDLITSLTKKQVGSLLTPLVGSLAESFDPARFGVKIAAICATHDPCERCGHGRLLHRRTAIQDPEIAAHDQALGETHCRHGWHHAQVPRVREGCSCESHVGPTTPLPSWMRGAP